LVPVAVASQLRQLSANLEVNIVNGAGHVPFLSHPQELLALIRRFMDTRCP
jgi:pimeloyl-[acyl-carrier protein] methyl ester esterase